MAAQQLFQDCLSSKYRETKRLTSAEANESSSYEVGQLSGAATASAPNPGLRMHDSPYLWLSTGQTEYAVGEQRTAHTWNHAYPDGALMTAQTDACLPLSESEHQQPNIEMHSSCTLMVQSTQRCVTPHMPPRLLPVVTAVHIKPILLKSTCHHYSAPLQTFLGW